MREDPTQKACEGTAKAFGTSRPTRGLDAERAVCPIPRERRAAGALSTSAAGASAALCQNRFPELLDCGFCLRVRFSWTI